MRSHYATWCAKYETQHLVSSIDVDQLPAHQVLARSGRAPGAAAGDRYQLQDVDHQHAGPGIVFVYPKTYSRHIQTNTVPA